MSASGMPIDNGAPVDVSQQAARDFGEALAKRFDAEEEHSAAFALKAHAEHNRSLAEKYESDADTWRTAARMARGLE